MQQPMIQCMELAISQSFQKYMGMADFFVISQKETDKTIHGSNEEIAEEITWW